MENRASLRASCLSGPSSSCLTYNFHVNRDESCELLNPVLKYLLLRFLYLKVYFDYMRSWIQMLQQLPQASHSLKNLLEEEWNFTKEITHYIRGGEAQAGKLFW